MVRLLVAFVLVFGLAVEANAFFFFGRPRVVNNVTVVNNAVPVAPAAVQVNNFGGGSRFVPRASFNGSRFVRTPSGRLVRVR